MVCFWVVAPCTFLATCHVLRKYITLPGNPQIIQRTLMSINNGCGSTNPNFAQGHGFAKRGFTRLAKEFPAIYGSRMFIT
jgi:hypothetical protein